MPAPRYWESSAVWPARAKSKSLVARASASGGREDADFGGCGSFCCCGGSCACGRPILSDGYDIGSGDGATMGGVFRKVCNSRSNLISLLMSFPSHRPLSSCDEITVANFGDRSNGSAHSNGRQP